MIFHENRLLADDSHEISIHFFSRKFGKMLRILSSAAFVFGALRVNVLQNVFTSEADLYNYVNVYCRELAPGTVSLTGDIAQEDDSTHCTY